MFLRFFHYNEFKLIFIWIQVVEKTLKNFQIFTSNHNWNYIKFFFFFQFYITEILYFCQVSISFFDWVLMLCRKNDFTLNTPWIQSNSCGFQKNLEKKDIIVHSVFFLLTYIFFNIIKKKNFIKTYRETTMIDFFFQESFNIPILSPFESFWKWIMYLYY